MTDDQIKLASLQQTRDTLTKIYQGRMEDINKQIASISEGVAVIKTEVVNIKDSINDMHSTLKEHNGRLRTLEIWKWGLAGGLAVITFLGASGIKSWLNDGKQDQSIQKQEIKSVVEDILSNKSFQINENR